MYRRFRLVRIAGIPIEAEPSFFILIPILTVLFVQYFGSSMRHSPQSYIMTASLVATTLFIGSLLIHEFTHATVAGMLGLKIRAVRLFIFGGATDIVTAPRAASQELLIALAGPAATLIISAMMFGLATVYSPISLFSKIAWIIGRINFYLVLLNIIPVFPFDGGRALRAVLWMIYGDYSRASSTVRAFAIGIGYLLLLGAAGLFLMKMLTWAAVSGIAGWRLLNLIGTGASEDRHLSQHVTAT